MTAWRTRLWTWRWPLMVGAVIGLGLALRLYNAWMTRFSTSPDFGISALVAKHMAEGRDYPTFFYGQAYMGNVEAVVTAVLCRLSGLPPTGFMVLLGTALVGVLLLPLLYVFARDAGSRRAGLIAMLYCLVGSDTNFHYSVASRGSYMVMMAAGLFVLWQSCRIATRLARGESVPWSTYLVVGLAAGLGWWGTQLVVVFLFAAGLILLTAFRPRLLRGLLPAGLGFVVGGLPWWIWNVRHHWGTFNFQKSVGSMPLSKGLQYFWNQFLKLVELSPADRWWDIARLAVLLAMGALFVVLLVHDRRRHREDDRFRFRLAALLLLASMAVIHATSRYASLNASRYLLPAIPAVAIMLGVGTDWLLCRLRWPLGWIVFIALLPEQVYLLPRMSDGLATGRAQWQAAERLVDELSPLCDGVCLTTFTTSWMNFATGERLCFASLPEERYAPYARRAELSLRPAFLNGYEDVAVFVATTGGRSRQVVLQGMGVDHDLTPPPDTWRYVDQAAIAGIEDREGRPWGESLQDARVDTRWSAIVDPQAPEALMVSFRRPIAACGLRLLSGNGAYPRAIRIESQAAGQADWHGLLETGTTRFFWSGPYAQIDGLQFFQEFRFTPPTGGLNRLRLTFTDPSRRYPVTLSEVLVLEEAPAPTGSAPTLDACLTALRTNQVGRIYAPRWLEEGIATTSRFAIDTPAPSALTRTVEEQVQDDPVRPLPVEVTGITGFLATGHDADRTREVIGGAGLQWREVPVGSHTLFIVTPSDRDRELPVPPLFWTELGCFTARFSKPQAESWYRKAADCAARGDAAARLDRLRRAVNAYPFHQPAQRELITALRAQGHTVEAETQAARLKQETEPAVPAPIRFSNGIEFLGITLSSTETAPGKTVNVTYYWKLPANRLPDKPVVFVHWERGRSRFQDDHGLLESEWPDDGSAQPFQEIVREERRLLVPASTQPGEYRLIVGLLDPLRNRRLSAKTGLDQRRSAVRCPVALRVLPAP